MTQRAHPDIMWIAKPIYEAVPLYYLAIGAAGVWASFYLDVWYWRDILALAGVLMILAGLVLLLRRKGYRKSRSRIDFDEIS